MSHSLVGEGFRVDLDGVTGRPVAAFHADCGRTATIEGDRVWCPACGWGSVMPRWPSYPEHRDRINLDPERQLIAVTPLEVLTREMTECRKCALRASANRVVIGGGRFEAPLWIVGEAPGRDEDREGEPFVGWAGKILREMEAEARITSDGVYRTNVLKCRPTDNVFPGLEVSRVCLEHLEDQLTLGAPRVVVLAGSKAVNHVLYGGAGGPSMEDCVGVAYRHSEKWPQIGYCFPIWHPSFIGRMRKQAPAKADQMRKKIVEILTAARAVAGDLAAGKQPFVRFSWGGGLADTVDLGADEEPGAGQRGLFEGGQA